MEVKVEVRRMEKQSSERHLERLRDGRADSLQTSSLHLDMLRDLKRINAHIVSVAHPILDESGLLIESRLRDAAPNKPQSADGSRRMVNSIRSPSSCRQLSTSVQ